LVSLSHVNIFFPYAFVIQDFLFKESVQVGTSRPKLVTKFWLYIILIYKHLGTLILCHMRRYGVDVKSCIDLR